MVLLFVVSPAESQKNSKISVSRIAEFDTLLVHLETQALDSLIHTYSPIVSDDPNLLDWDSVRTTYSEVALEIVAGRSNDSASRTVLTQILPNSSSRFTIDEAGALAAAAYELSTEMFQRNDVAAAYSEYMIARHFRLTHIAGEVVRLLRNADEAEMLISHARLKLAELRQERLDSGNVPEISEILRFCSLYKSENSQAAAFRIVGPGLGPRYEKIFTEMQEIISQRRRETESEFKDIRYAFSISGGSYYSTGEFYPPYDLVLKVSDGSGNIVDASFSFAQAETDPPPRVVYFGEIIMAGVTTYLRDNLTLEVNCSYSKINRERPLIHPWLDKPFVIQAYSSPITYTSFGVMLDYLLRVKTGFRPLTGLGLSYVVANAPESNSVRDIYHNGTFVSTPVGKTQTTRLLFRSGVEFLPSEASPLSYSVIVDASLRLHSSQEIAPLFIQSQLRISWLY